ncbi:NAD-dependent succinate-semialdehyde dehydrogenase [Nakamurella sp.]|uniref:NAD-dependent succinate-semialdehyde dehydrogenase n=1 Tax=Nakamurella sp. TaxID=1869182 RepID=UPI0037835442
MFAVTNPATGREESRYATATDAEIEQILASSETAARELAGSELDRRCAALGRIAELHDERRDELAMLVTTEVGKPIRQARGELGLVASIYRYYAERSTQFLADDEITTGAGGSAVVRKVPVGPLLGIMPWNFPYYQAARFAAPNLAAGNTIVLKPAPQCPSSALAQDAIIRQALSESGLPVDGFQTVLAGNEQIATMIADPRVRGVSLTGSERAGAAVAAIAGRHLKKVVLELGGSDPFVVLDAADLDRVVKRAVHARLANAGQACNAAKRFIVLDDLYDEFVDRFATAMGRIEPGDPTLDSTFLGPLSSKDARDTLADQVDRAVAQGARVLTGGRRTDGPGYGYRPTVLTGVTAEMDVFNQELFGPVAVVHRATDEDDAVALANATPFGLGASVHSDDPERAARVADRLDAGMVSINESGGSSADLPFGGVKRSGFGRELGSYGISEFVNHKLVRTAPAR